ncbi:transcription factor Adf-1-like [Eupeodes corollae]|uniref:transcription factor Adf-1-like n=1 Tax=Eupeodes corollae TaxID=290404 RepID=UPI002493ADED|nr:transcription factor Adf-1-like [Eupeodes corollae]
MANINEKLVEIVRCHAILWDLTNPNYKNIKKKAAIWKNIADELGLPIDVCKKKWKTLRDCFSRELHKKPKSVQAAEEPESSWKFRDQMKFIREHMKPRPTTRNITSSLCNMEDINDSQALKNRNSICLIPQTCSNNHAIEL